jgi:hypothetical protein
MIAIAQTAARGDGALVASKVEDHANSLSQGLFCGFPLQMPAPSVLGSDAIELGADAVLSEAELNFDFLTAVESAKGQAVRSAAVRSDGEVSSDAWIVRLRREGEKIRHQLRKYGDDV